jgi:hypothetical protein
MPRQPRSRDRRGQEPRSVPRRPDLLLDTRTPDEPDTSFGYSRRALIDVIGPSVPTDSPVSLPNMRNLLATTMQPRPVVASGAFPTDPPTTRRTSVRCSPSIRGWHKIVGRWSDDPFPDDSRGRA